MKPKYSFIDVLNSVGTHFFLLLFSLNKLEIDFAIAIAVYARTFAVAVFLLYLMKGANK